MQQQRTSLKTLSWEGQAVGRAHWFCTLSRPVTPRRELEECSSHCARRFRAPQARTGPLGGENAPAVATAANAIVSNFAAPSWGGVVHKFGPAGGGERVPSDNRLEKGARVAAPLAGNSPTLAPAHRGGEQRRWTLRVCACVCAGARGQSLAVISARQAQRATLAASSSLELSLGGGLLGSQLFECSTGRGSGWRASALQRSASSVRTRTRGLLDCLVAALLMCVCLCVRLDHDKRKYKQSIGWANCG